MGLNRSDQYHRTTPFEYLVLQALWIIIRSVVLKRTTDTAKVDEWRHNAVELGRNERSYHDHREWMEDMPPS